MVRVHNSLSADRGVIDPDTFPPLVPQRSSHHNRSLHSRNSNLGVDGSGGELPRLWRSELEYVGPADEHSLVLYQSGLVGHHVPRDLPDNIRYGVQSAREWA